MNGEPAALIAATRREVDYVHVLPLFMAVQSWMKVTHHEQQEALPAGERGHV